MPYFLQKYSGRIGRREKRKPSMVKALEKTVCQCCFHTIKSPLPVKQSQMNHQTYTISLLKENPSPCQNIFFLLLITFSSTDHQQVLQIVLPNRIKVTVVTGIRLPIPYDHVNCPAAVKSSVLHSFVKHSNPTHFCIQFLSRAKQFQYAQKPLGYAYLCFNITLGK